MFNRREDEAIPQTLQTEHKVKRDRKRERLGNNHTCQHTIHNLKGGENIHEKSEYIQNKHRDNQKCLICRVLATYKINIPVPSVYS